jgi:hypothetical protein
VSILFGDHGTNRCRCGFYRRAGGVGREGVSQKERVSRNRPHVVNTYNYLDLVPKGRDEDDLPFTMPITMWMANWLMSIGRTGPRTLCPHSECSSTLKSASQAQINADSRYSLGRRVYDNRRQSSSGDRG